MKTDVGEEVCLEVSKLVNILLGKILYIIILKIQSITTKLTSPYASLSFFWQSLRISLTLISIHSENMIYRISMAAWMHHQRDTYSKIGKKSNEENGASFCK